MSSFLWDSFGSIISMSFSGFGISGLLYFSFSCSTSLCNPFGFFCNSILGSGDFSVSSLWTSSEIDLAASAFTEIESMPCFTRNSTILGFEPACPQIDVSILCFLHSRITLEICFRTAQFISS